MGLFQKISRSFREPTCHLTPEEKAWVENRMLWLHSQFGKQPIGRAPIDPASPLLPTRWDGSCEAGADLFGRLCGFMLVDATRIELDYFSEEEPPRLMSDFYESERHGPAGLFIHPEDKNRLVIALDTAGLSHPGSLAATICHELGHVHLIADRRITPNTEDGEPLTDLLTVFFGAGILTANTAFQFSQWQDGRMQGWSTSRQGYLSEALFGYALASYSWYRGDKASPWKKHLRENIAYYFEDSAHYLEKTNDTTIPFGGA